MNNTILSLIEGFTNKTVICIGLGKENVQNLKIAKISRAFTKQNICTILMIGDIDSNNLTDEDYDALIKTEKIDDFERFIEELRVTISKLKNLTGVIQIITEYPAKLLINLVFKGKEFSGVRGSLSSAGFLKHLKNKGENEKRNLYRIALMETSEGQQFFFAPVGIDEAITLENKQTFIKNIEEILKLLYILPKISILSGGRKGDIGRDERVDKSILDANKLETFFQNQFEIRNEQILIENAIKNKTNFILAPDGVSGNLIYRTLVHLGGGKAFGALYSSIYLKEKKTIIDCSRIANEPEILGSLILASGFFNLSKK